MWYASVIEQVQEEISKQGVQRFASDGNFGYLYMLGVAHDITAYHYHRYMIIPTEFQSHLPDYDLRNDLHLHLQLNPFLYENEKADVILVKVSFEEYKNGIVDWIGEDKATEVTLEQWIDKLNKRITEDAKIKVDWDFNGESGIFVPYSDRLIDETFLEVKRLRKKKEPN